MRSSVGYTASAFPAGIGDAWMRILVQPSPCQQRLRCLALHKLSCDAPLHHALALMTIITSKTIKPLLDHEHATVAEMLLLHTRHERRTVAADPMHPGCACFKRFNTPGQPASALRMGTYAWNAHALRVGPLCSALSTSSASHCKQRNAYERPTETRCRDVAHAA